MVVVIKEPNYELLSSEPEDAAAKTTPTESTNAEASKDLFRLIEEKKTIISEERQEQILLQIKEVLKQRNMQIPSAPMETYTVRKRRKSLPSVSRHVAEEKHIKENKHLLNFLSCWTAVFD